MSFLGNNAFNSGPKAPAGRTATAEAAVPATRGPVRPDTASPPRPAVQQPRSQYVVLKANVHRKLLNRLNLEALANADRSRAESEIRTLVGELLAEENTPLSLGERDVLFGELVDEVFGLG